MTNKAAGTFCGTTFPTSIKWHLQLSLSATSHALVCAYNLVPYTLHVLSQIDQCEAILMKDHPVWLALCHNDLQYGNIMVKAATLDTISVQSMDEVPSPGQHSTTLMPVATSHETPAEVPDTAITDMRRRALHHAAPQPSSSTTDAACTSVNMLSVRDEVAVTSWVTHCQPGSPPTALRASSSDATGSLLLPALACRPRGQSPERKRPEAGSPRTLVPAARQFHKTALQASGTQTGPWWLLLPSSRYM